MTYLFVKHIPKNEEGMVSYDLEQIRREIPMEYKSLTEEPEKNITPSGVTVYFECVKTKN